MPDALQITTLGGLTITLDGAPLGALASRKAEALLVYLACERRAHQRDLLADLLWDDLPIERARGNLSVLLTSLRQRLGAFLRIDRQTVALDPAAHWADAPLLTAQIAAAEAARRAGPLTPDALGELERALLLYRGDFLVGFGLRDATGFERWALAEQESIRQMVIGARALLAQDALDRRDPAAGVAHASALLQLDPYQETGHRLLIELLAASGQRAAARAHYQAYCHLIATELGLGPDPAVTAAYAALSVAPAPLAATDATLRGAPELLTPFIGRDDERAAIGALLADPACRLLTLLGPGGIGKTRLAAQAAAEAAARYEHGAVFVPLAAVPLADGVPTAIAEALGLRYIGRSEPRAQLLAFLRERRLLLVLDNLEHLRGVAELVELLLREVSGLTVLCTSRERLNLHAEWIFDLRGMACPPPAELPDVSSLERYSAVQLFVQSAARVRRGFALTLELAPAIAQICQLVDGTPLAIELAAAWVRSLAPDALAAEIGRSLDLLTTAQHDVPTRHRSMRAVFDHSWQLLPPPERAVLQQIAVFRGGFTLEAARAVVAADAPLLGALAGLVDASLLRQDATGRYDLHELVRQYAHERLVGAGAAYAEVSTRHARYYAGWLSSYEEPLRGMAQRAALAAIGAELENLHQAWAWALATRDLTALTQQLPALTLFYDIVGRFQEGADRFGQAIAALERDQPQPAPVIAWLHVWHGLLDERLGRYASAAAHVHQGLSALRVLDAPDGVAMALSLLGRIAERQGEFAETVRLNQEALAISAAHGDQRGVANALHGLASGHEGLQHYAEARTLMERSLALRRALGMGRGTAFSLNTLGVIVEMLGEPQLALTLYEQSLVLFRELGELWAITLPLSNMGDVALTLGHPAQARDYYVQALRNAQEIWALPQICMLLVKIAALLAQTGDHLGAVETLALPRTHLATEQFFRALAERLLAEAAAQHPAQQIAAALELGLSRSIPATVRTLMAE